MPKLTFSNRGVASDYTGGRNSRALIDWVRNQANVSPQVTDSIDVDEDISQTDIDLDNFL